MTAYAARVQPGIGHIQYREAQYGAVTRAYLVDVVKQFPADVIVRAYASVLRIVELLFVGPAADDDDDGQPPPRRAANGTGLALVVAAIAVAMTANTRTGLFLLFFVLYFCGFRGSSSTPAISSTSNSSPGGRPGSCCNRPSVTFVR